MSWKKKSRGKSIQARNTQNLTQHTNNQHQFKLLYPFFPLFLLTWPEHGILAMVVTVVLAKIMLITMEAETCQSEILVAAAITNAVQI